MVKGTSRHHFIVLAKQTRQNYKDVNSFEIFWTFEGVKFSPLTHFTIFFLGRSSFTLDVLVNITAAILSSHQQSLNNQHASNLFFKKVKQKGLCTSFLKKH